MSVVDRPVPSAGAADLAELFRRRGDHPAVISPDGALTYGQLGERVRELAGELGGERRLVAVEGANRVDALVASLAATDAGHPVLLLPGPGADGVARTILDAYRPGVVLDSSNGWWPEAAMPGQPVDLHPDLALLLSTSGSTGSPKLVRLSHENLRSNAAAIAGYLRLTPDDRAMATLPMHYCYGLSVINSHLHAGATVVLSDLSVVDPCYWDLFRRSGATNLAGVPHSFTLLDRVDFASMELPGLRFVTQAGGRLSPEAVRRYAELGARRGFELFVMYGQTEATARMAYLPPELASRRPEAIGVAIPGGELRVDRPDERGVGELVYRGPNTMLGYASGLDDLARGATVDELRTGDLGRVAVDGLVEVVGRRSRFIKPFGVRLDLDRAEAVLAEHGVAAVCTGDDDGLVVAVSREDEVAVAERLVDEHLAVPRRHAVVLHVAEVPRLGSGKPDHGTLVRLARAHRPPGPGAGPRPASVRAAFAELLHAEPTDEDTFVSLGGDSLSYVEMSVRLEHLLGTLPVGWHLVPIGELESRRRPAGALAATETSVVLRAVAIVLIVGTHASLWRLPGGAHALLAVAGYNFARFQVRAGSMLASAARIAVPSACWIAVVAAVSDKYGWPNALLVNNLVERDVDRWGYWFIEALVQILVVLAALSAVPAFARVDRRWPFAVPVAAVVAGLLVRFDVVDISTTQRTTRPHEVLWLFALGWAAARATDWRQRAVVTVLATVGIADYFQDPGRELIVLGGVALLVWLPTLPVPRVAHRLLVPVAAASLYVYLLHWQVFPPLGRLAGPAAATAGSVLVGVVAWRALRPVSTAVEAAVVRRVGRGRARGVARPLSGLPGRVNSASLTSRRPR